MAFFPIMLSKDYVHSLLQNQVYHYPVNVKDLIKENKHSAARILKEITMRHLADRILDKGKAYAGQYKA